MAENDILVPRENAAGGFDERVLAPADIGAVASTDARLTDARTPTSHTHGNLSNAGAIGTTSGLPVKTGTSGVLEAGAFGTAAGQFAEGNHTHSPSSLGAAPAVNVIELTPSPGSTTITTSQLPARGIAFIEGGGSFTVNLPTPDKRQSGLTFSIKVEHEGASGDVFITVVHNASDLLTSYELDEDESSLDFLWDGYRWTYSSANWLYSYPNRRLIIPPLSGTLGLAEPSDSTFRIVGSSDATKKVAFEVDGLTAATTRTLTVPNANITLENTGHAAKHATGGTDAMTAFSIGGESLYVGVSLTVFGATTISAGRAQIYTLNVFSASTITFPTTGTELGDRLVIRGGSPVLATATMSATGVSDTITREGQQLSYVYQNVGGALRWVRLLVDDHDAAAVTTGTFANARINFAAPAAIGNTTPNTIAGTELALHDGSDTGTFVASGNLTDDRTYDLPDRSGTMVVSDTSAGSGSDVVNNIVSLTQAEYDAIGSPDAATLFLITDP